MDKTTVIVTFSHCGTTMLAGMLEIFGVPMVGKNYHKMKWEDHDVIEALQDEDQFAALVAKRNQLWSTWGFKYPGAWNFMPLLKRHLRNPVYLAIFKDPVSVTRRRLGKSNGRFSHTLRSTIRQYRRSMDALYASGETVHYFSYQKAVMSPREFALELVEVVDLPVSDERIDRAVSYIQPNDAEPKRRYPSVEPWIER